MIGSKDAYQRTFAYVHHQQQIMAALAPHSSLVSDEKRSGKLTRVCPDLTATFGLAGPCSQPCCSTSAGSLSRLHRAVCSSGG